MTKKDFELIAETIYSEARPALSNMRMYKSTNRERANEECGMNSKLQALWGLTLKLSNRLEASNPRFDAKRFIDACGTSPQNWRFMDWYETPEGAKYMNGEEAKRENYSLYTR